MEYTEAFNTLDFQELARYTSVSPLNIESSLEFCSRVSGYAHLEPEELSGTIKPDTTKLVQTKYSISRAKWLNLNGSLGKFVIKRANRCPRIGNRFRQEFDPRSSLQYIR